MCAFSMDSEGFITSIEEQLVKLAPITKFIIVKQLKDIGVTRTDLTPDKATTFIDRMTNALILCLGKDGSQFARRMMMKQLRLYAPEHFENQGVLNPGV